MLMLIYAIDEAAAFELLKWRSQETNVKLRILAEQVAADFVAAQRYRRRSHLGPPSTNCY